MSGELRAKREGRRLLPAFCVLALVVGACGRAPDPVTAYVGATVFDGTGAAAVPNSVILVSEGHIVDVGPASRVRIPDRAPRVQLDGKWVIPGLVDGHVHATRWTLSRYLAYGVTGVRDVGGNTDSLVALRAQVAAGTVPGPRLFIAGTMIDGAPAVWPGVTELRDPAEAPAAVARLAAAGVNQIKLYVHTTRPLLEAVVREADARGIPVTAHLGLVDALTAARLGVASIEHLSGVVEATVRNPAPYFAAHARFFDGWKAFLRGWGTLDSAALDQTASTLVNTGLMIVPTLVQSETYARLDDAAYVHGLDLSGVPAEEQEAWDLPGLRRRAQLTPADFAAFRRSRPLEDWFIYNYVARGGAVVAGSDSPNQLLAPGASLHHELALLVRAGLTPARALVAATSSAGGLLRADSIGVLKRGAVADFVVLGADPTADIGNSTRVEQVIAAGRRYSTEELRRGW